MALKDYSDNEAVRSRGQDLVSTNSKFGITVIMREMVPIGEMAPVGEMAPGCGKRSTKEIFNYIFAPPSERWHRVRSQRCKSKSECYRTGPTPRECCCLQFERDGVARSPSCWPGPFHCEAWLWALAFLGAFMVVICCQQLVDGLSCCQSVRS